MAAPKPSSPPTRADLAALAILLACAGLAGVLAWRSVAKGGPPSMAALAPALLLLAASLCAPFRRRSRAAGVAQWLLIGAALTALVVGSPAAR